MSATKYEVYNTGTGARIGGATFETMTAAVLFGLGLAAHSGWDTRPARAETKGSGEAGK